MVDGEPKPKNSPDLERAKFYDNLHKKVAGGLLSIEDANKQVEQYDRLQDHFQQILIPGTTWSVRRFW